MARNLATVPSLAAPKSSNSFPKVDVNPMNRFTASTGT
jgi:hypothetical protein